MEEDKPMATAVYLLLHCDEGKEEQIRQVCKVQVSALGCGWMQCSLQAPAPLGSLSKVPG